MKLSNGINNGYRRCGLSGIFVFTLIVLMSSSAFGMTQVGLYDVWETKVTNSKTYSNPFDFNVIELRATFTSPSGSKINFFGFYDGNGNGGQNGNVWKLRFMPDKVGTWKYTYSWTDGTSGGSGTFQVNDTGLPGPLQVDNNGTNSWYFKDSRNAPFHARAYSIENIGKAAPSQSIINDEGWALSLIRNEVINRGYNFVMVEGLSTRKSRDSANFKESWWLDSSNTKVFHVAAWGAFERQLNLLADNKTYVMPFAGMFYQDSIYGFTDMKVFLRYWVARFGAYYNFLGWNPTWEWTDVWSASQVNQIMGQVESWDPFSRMLSIHDCSQSSFTGWLDFSMRQAQSRTVFDGNSRTAGQRQGSCDGSGGIGSPFLNRPIIGSEDIWEMTSGSNGQPRNGTEVRRAAWGIQMAGVIPMYSEWNYQNPGNGQREPDIRRMFDFFYSKTQYRQYKQLNHLVSSSARQIASGIANQEYLVYDENGGPITINLSSAGGSNTFDVLWYNPTSGATQNGGKVNGGASRTLQSPYSGDTVLRLTKGAPDNVAPKAPAGLKLTTN